MRPSSSLCGWDPEGHCLSGAEQNNPGLPPKASSAVAAPSENTESKRWSFVVFGDTRDATQDTQTGISPLLRRIAEGIAAEKPALVIHTGDLINGYYTHANLACSRQI